MAPAGPGGVPRRHGRPRPPQDPLATVRHLGAAYFHQDHDLEGGDPPGVVRRFAADAGEEGVAALRREVAHLLATARDDEELAAAWSGTGASYEPRRVDGISYREWFETVVAVLDGRHPDDTPSGRGRRGASGRPSSSRRRGT